MPTMSDDTSQPEVSLEPGDVSAQDLVALHHDLEGDPASGAGARAAAGQVAAAGGPTPVAAAPDAGARQAAGVVDETRWDGTPPRPKRRGRWLVVGAAVLVIAAGAIGAAMIVNNTSSSSSSKPKVSTSSSAVPVVKSLQAISTPITTCLERVRQPYQIVKNAKSYVGKTAVVAAEGSREGSAQAVVQANGTFTVVFTQPLQRVSATKCSGKLTLTVESIGGVTPTVIS